MPETLADGDKHRTGLGRPGRPGNLNLTGIEGLKGLIPALITIICILQLFHYGREAARETIKSCPFT